MNKFTQILILVVTIIFFLITLSCAKLNEPASVVGILNIAKNIDTVGYARDIYIGEQFLYVAEDQAGFSIYDLESDTLVVHYIGNIENARLISVVEEYDFLFIYDRYGSPAQIRVYDISDPANPVIKPPIISNTAGIEAMRCFPGDDGSVEMALTRNDTEFEFKYAVWDGFYFIPEYTYDDYTVNLNGFDLDDNYIYLSYEQLGVNITDRATGDFISITDTPGEALDVKVVDNHLIVADKTLGFTIFNIDDITDPQLVSSGDTSGYAQDIDVVDDLMAIASGGGGVYLYDISDISNPEYLDRIDDHDIGYCYKVKFHNNYLYAATKYGVSKLAIDY